MYRQYDHMVRIGTAVRPGQGDAAVVRFTGQREGGVAMSVGCNSRWCYLEPRLGATHPVVASFSSGLEQTLRANVLQRIQTVSFRDLAHD